MNIMRTAHTIELYHTSSNTRLPFDCYRKFQYKLKNNSPTPYIAKKQLLPNVTHLFSYYMPPEEPPWKDRMNESNENVAEPKGAKNSHMLDEEKGKPRIVLNSKKTVQARHI